MAVRRVPIQTLAEPEHGAMALEGEQTGLPPLPGNLVVWGSKTMSTRWASVKRRPDCPVCNADTWLAEREAALEAKGAAGGSTSHAETMR